MNDDSLDLTRLRIGDIYEWGTRNSQKGTKLRGGSAVLVKCVVPVNHKHGDNDPSMKLSLTDNVFQCFACGIGGGIIDLVIAMGVARDRPEISDKLRAIGWLKQQTGTDHAGPLHKQPPSSRKRKKGEPLTNERLEDLFRYTDEHGELLYTVLKIVGDNHENKRTKRFEVFQPAQPQSFPRETVKDESTYLRPAGDIAFRIRMIVGREQGQTRWELIYPSGTIEHIAMHTRGVRIVPYALPDLVRARRAGRAVFFIEGETDAKTLQQLGFVATSSPFGAGFEITERWQRYFKGVGALIHGTDSDTSGRTSAAKRLAALEPAAKRSALLDFFPESNDGEDVTEFVRVRRTAGETDPEIRAAIENLARTALAAANAPTPPPLMERLADTKPDAPDADANAARVGPAPTPAATAPENPTLVSSPAVTAASTSLVPTFDVEFDEPYVALLPKNGRGAMRILPLTAWEDNPPATHLVSSPMSRESAEEIDVSYPGWMTADELASTLPKLAR
jgi:hypothetical protein